MAAKAPAKKKGGLTAAGGANEDEELAICDVDVQLVYRGAVTARVQTRCVVESYSSHRHFSFTGRYVPDDP